MIYFKTFENQLKSKAVLILTEKIKLDEKELYADDVEDYKKRLERSKAANYLKNKNRGMGVAVNCCVAYTFCYTLRNILSALMPTILKSGDFSEGQLGTYGSVMLILYACGQFINGFLGDRIKAKYMVSVGLFSAGVCTFLFSLPVFAGLGALLWGVIGFSLSMLWGPITRTIVESCHESRATFYLALASASSYVGMFLAYILAIVAAEHGIWRECFAVSGAAVAAAAVAHYFLLSHAENGSTGAVASFGNDSKRDNECKRTSIFKNFKAEILKKPFIIMLFVTMLNGTVKHAVAYWIPTYFSKNLSIGERAASVISAIIPVIGIGTGFFAVFLYKLIKSDIKALILLFSASAVSFLLVTVGGKTVWLPVVGMLLSNAAMGTANSVIFNMYCLRFRETGHVSSVSGLLDSACYAASAAANMLFTVVISAAGFGSAVWVWFSLSALGVAAAFFADRAYSG